MGSNVCATVLVKCSQQPSQKNFQTDSQRTATLCVKRQHDLGVKHLPQEMHASCKGGLMHLLLRAWFDNSSEFNTLTTAGTVPHDNKHDCATLSPL